MKMNLLWIPKEIIFEILCFLSPADLQSLFLVNKYFNEFSFNEKLWNILFENYFKRTNDTQIASKEYFRRKWFIHQLTFEQIQKHIELHGASVFYGFDSKENKLLLVSIKPKLNRYLIHYSPIDLSKYEAESDKLIFALGAYLLSDAEIKLEKNLQFFQRKMQQGWIFGLEIICNPNSEIFTSNKFIKKDLNGNLSVSIVANEKLKNKYQEYLNVITNRIPWIFYDNAKILVQCLTLIPK